MIRTAHTENGVLRGIEAADPRITAFKGIPFAAPPVGKNRWRAPQPAASWEGVREACRFAPISMQSVPGLGTDIYCREWHVDPEIPMSEDCLYLNVWTGAKNPEERRPVLVWFFGGALQWGYPAEMEFDGERLARRGIVVVSVNYRLNVFGFLAHPQLTREQPQAPCNFGSLDQQAGLRWVARNIAAFGGDPGNVTIAGQSAGGGSVLSQMACKDNAGLFQKAVIMSAMIRSPYQEGGVGVPEELADAEKNGEAFFAELGVGTLEEARELDAALIRDRYYEYIRSHPAMFTVLDGHFCVGDPLAMYAAGECVDVAVMAGNTEDEFLSGISASDEEELEREARRIFGDSADKFLACPEAHVRTDAGYASVNGISCTVKSEFLANAAGSRPRANYCYSFRSDIPGWDNPGTFHSVDLWFFFETLAKCWRPFTGRHYDLARQMCNYWANFIATGNPNGKDADGKDMPVWDAYTPEHRAEMIFTGDGPVAVTNEETDFIRMLTDQIGGMLKQDSGAVRRDGKSD